MLGFLKPILITYKSFPLTFKKIIGERKERKIHTAIKGSSLM